MVNGAGLAMATMDLIEHHGGSPANFLDKIKLLGDRITILQAECSKWVNAKFNNLIRCFTGNFFNIHATFK
jgi:hypothetical protein